MLALLSKYKSDARSATVFQCFLFAGQLDQNVPSDIAGLVNLSKPLLFLGLFDCDDACTFKRIPADAVSGTATYGQIQTALRMYVHRPEILTKLCASVEQALSTSQLQECDRENNRLPLIGLLTTVSKMHIGMEEIQVRQSLTLVCLWENIVSLFVLDTSPWL